MLRALLAQDKSKARNGMVIFSLSVAPCGVKMQKTDTTVELSLAAGCSLSLLTISQKIYITA